MATVNERLAAIERTLAELNEMVTRIAAVQEVEALVNDALSGVPSRRPPAPARLLRGRSPAGNQDRSRLRIV